MIGDAILLVKPQIYTVVLQLVFESLIIQYKTKQQEDIMYVRRITDITSPFENVHVDHLPVSKLFKLQNLDIIVKYFCMIEISDNERKRLIERRFIPQDLIDKTGGVE